jgi:hypothetical protein
VETKTANPLNWFRVQPGAVREYIFRGDLMIRRGDLEKVIIVAEEHGIRLSDSNRDRDAIHLLFSDEKVKAAQIEPNPPLTPEQVEARGQTVWIIPIRNLVRMKLTTNRLVDQVHIKDMDEVGLITPEIERTLSPELLKRLQDTRQRE